MSLKNLLTQLRSILLYATVFLVPWFFLPITQEFFLTHKYYLIFVSVLTSIVLVALSLLLHKKIHLIKTSFDKVLILFGCTQVIALVFSSTNKLQALTSLPWGLAPILACIALYFVIVNTYDKKKYIDSIMTALTVGMGVAALAAIVFWFEPLKNAQLPLTLDFS
ncbi:MAG: hypothetical protein UZ22_OP11002000888 [Microgenomates bacterium OLB23]|nr:MAG: hypothetical protein UZ22_OP11002000888 [Microgenomates bacterium OLB23]